VVPQHVRRSRRVSGAVLRSTISSASALRLTRADATALLAGAVDTTYIPHPSGDHQIRRSGHIVQDRPSLVIRRTDIPQLSAWDASCPAAWRPFVPN